MLNRPEQYDLASTISSEIPVRSDPSRLLNFKFPTLNCNAHELSCCNTAYVCSSVAQYACIHL